MVDTQETFQFSDYFDILRRRVGIVIAAFVIIVVAVTVITFLMTPIYRATALVLIDIESPQVLTTTGAVEIGSPWSSSYYSYREYFKSQMGIIKSHSIAEQVFKEFNILKLEEFAKVKEPIKKFLKTIDVEAVRDTRLLRLNVENKDPALAKKIANRIADIYIRRNLAYISQSEWLNLLKNEYLRLETRLSEYSKIYKGGHPEMIRLKDEMAEMATNIARAKDVDFTAYMSQEEAAKQSYRHALEGLKANNVSIIDYAKTPIVPVKPKKLLNILMAIIMGFFGGIGLAFFFEYQDVTIKDVEDIERLTSWPFLGKIPRIGGTKKELHVQRKMGDFITEAYRSIRTQLSFLDTKEYPLKSIVVTSLGAQEGKTTSVCNLGIVIAQNNKKVLLVEADMRKPRLHDVFKKKNSRGLNHFLSGEAGFDELLQETDVERLYFIGGNNTSHSPAELLSSEKMKEFMEIARKKFDYVIFDSPPIGILTDATILSRIADGVILVIESGKTPKRALLRNYKLYKNSKIRFAGVIINKVDVVGQEDYYYSYSYSGT
jgi:capsular exopolysaccharide synthesis family protein